MHMFWYTVGSTWLPKMTAMSTMDFQHLVKYWYRTRRAAALYVDMLRAKTLKNVAISFIIL